MIEAFGRGWHPYRDAFTLVNHPFGDPAVDHAEP
jgi:hypothetical protein